MRWESWPTGHNRAKAKGRQRQGFDMCYVAQNTENTPGWTRQGTHPSR